MKGRQQDAISRWKSNEREYDKRTKKMEVLKQRGLSRETTVNSPLTKPLDDLAGPWFNYAEKKL